MTSGCALLILIIKQLIYAKAGNINTTTMKINPEGKRYFEFTMRISPKNYRPIPHIKAAVRGSKKKLPNSIDSELSLLILHFRILNFLSPLSNYKSALYKGIDAPDNMRGYILVFISLSRPLGEFITWNMVQGLKPWTIISLFKVVNLGNFAVESFFFNYSIDIWSVSAFRQARKPSVVIQVGAGAPFQIWSKNWLSESIVFSVF